MTFLSRDETKQACIVYVLGGYRVTICEAGSNNELKTKQNFKSHPSAVKWAKKNM